MFILQKKNPQLIKLKNLRIENNLTTKQISEKLGMSKSSYSYIENGDRRLSYEQAILIADLFNKKPDDLFYEDFSKFYNDTLI